MKKLFLLMLAFIATLSLAACGNKTQEKQINNDIVERTNTKLNDVIPLDSGIQSVQEIIIKEQTYRLDARVDQSVDEWNIFIYEINLVENYNTATGKTKTNLSIISYTNDHYVDFELSLSINTTHTFQNIKLYDGSIDDFLTIVTSSDTFEGIIFDTATLINEETIYNLPLS